MGMKLTFIEPISHEGELTHCVDKRDIESKIEYWKCSLVFFVLGANPLFSVMEGFTKRLWGRKGLDKMYGLPDGVFLIRFHTTLERDEVTRHRLVYFDKKPMNLKPWTAGQTASKDDIASLPIWVKLHGLKWKFWSSQGLSKIGSSLGSPLAADKVTKEQTMLRYARILVDIKLNGAFLESVMFMDEEGQDRIGGNPIHADEIVAFQKCMDANSLQEVRHIGNTYTWSNRTIYSKIDRVIANGECFFTYTNIHYLMLAEGMSDHCPFQVKNKEGGRGQGFRFYNMWGDDPQFMEVVKTHWRPDDIKGSPIYQVTKSMKKLKLYLKQLHKRKFK
ncbi:LOW QUALITY PROTEIN: hypothetical protein Cgig2_014183 [Carnegiea gigantea]|uniref:DUF4283 domain-containing protein n=1 Tax=Carnegiea gigantea TaxID=171969 RepID=A0A9Q1JHP4_9CARY|nr:LOW QUALITY PROTEIN: hypothetical protein Cgig2_014183 [Carnegiea gigantea]